jgi:predicted phosphodiesterase
LKNRIAWKRITAILLTCCLLCSLLPLGAAAKATVGNLRFSAEGEFKILAITDMHQGSQYQPNMVRFIAAALDAHQPDLVVFDGDNLDGERSDPFASEAQMETSMRYFLTPLLERNVPFVVVQGNHDASYGRNSGFDSDAQYAMYRRIGGNLNLTRDPVPSLNGTGNCNVTIAASAGSKTAMNLYFLDCIEDNPLPEQMEWMAGISRSLKAHNGGATVPSMLFQHIVPAEVIEAQTPLPFSLGSLSRSFNDKSYGFLGDLWNFDGYPFEPVGGRSAEGEVEAIQAQGDIFAVVYGHNHLNYYQTVINNTRYINIPSCSELGSYGNFLFRGATLFTFHEGNPADFTMENVPYWKLINIQPLTLKEYWDYSPDFCQQKLLEPFSFLYYIVEMGAQAVLFPFKWVFRENKPVWVG